MQDDVWRFYYEPSMFGREVYILGGVAVVMAVVFYFLEHAQHPSPGKPFVRWCRLKPLTVVQMACPVPLCAMVGDRLVFTLC